MRTIATLLAGVFLISKTPAQPAAQPVENRFLLVFDTSSDMKQRLPLVQRSLNTLLASNMRGQIRTGDSIAVWTFDRELRTEHLVQSWAPENAATIASNIIRFVANQRYSKKTSFDALRPALNRVVQNSDRLTVLIFCDGNGQMTGTPFDPGINRVFEQQRAERKKLEEPFIVVLRSQLGNYTGCTMNSPPAPVNFPVFPPLPQPPMEFAKAPPPPPPASRPSVEALPLIVIGTKSATNAPPPAPALPPPPPPPPTTNQPPPAAAVPPTNASTNVKTNSPPLVVTAKPTNAPVAPSVSPEFPTAAVPTKATPPPSPPPPTAPPEDSGVRTLKALMIGGVLLGMAGVLAVLILGRGRKADHGSLITRSMNKSGKPSARM